MPIATVRQARDEMMARLKTALDASLFAGITVLYDDVQGDIPLGDPTNVPPPPDAPAGQPWLRAGIRHAEGRRASIGGINGKYRHEMSGLVFVQVFTPAGDGMKKSYDIAQVVLDAYRSGGATPGGIQFQNALLREIGNSGAWHQTNCLVDFLYDQIVSP
jgi:hypothetical protein